MTGDGRGSSGVGVYPEYVNLNISGITGTTPVDRMYFIKNQFDTGNIDPETTLRVYNGDSAFSFNYVEIKNGSTAVVSLTSDPRTVTDVTEQLKIKTIDMDNAQGGKVLLKHTLINSLVIVQVDETSTEVPVASIDTTQGVTDITVDSAGVGYIDGVNELTLGGGLPASGTGVTKGTFTVSVGQITDATVTHPGQNWTTAPDLIGFRDGVQVRSLNPQTSSGYNNDGTYPITFTGGNPTVAANGTFTVASGVVQQVDLVSGGRGYDSIPQAVCDEPGSAGTANIAVEISQSGAATATIGSTSTVDLSTSSSIIKYGVIEESSIGLSNPQPGGFTTLTASSSVSIGGSVDDVIDITGLIDGPIKFSVDNDTTAKNVLGTDKSRITTLEAIDITINKGDDEQVLLFKGGGVETKGAGVNTTQVGRIITDFTDETIAMESASDWAATGGDVCPHRNDDQKHQRQHYRRLSLPGD